MFVGSLPFSNDAVNATKVAVKSGRGLLHMLRLINTTGATAYLQVFDKLSADVTVGTTTPDWFVRLGSNESLQLPIPVPAQFLNGMVIAGTTTATGNTNAAISVTALFE